MPESFDAVATALNDLTISIGSSIIDPVVVVVILLVFISSRQYFSVPACVGVAKRVRTTASIVVFSCAHDSGEIPR